MVSSKNPSVFTGTLLPQGEKRWTSFGAGLGLECLALALLILIPLLMPQKFELAQHDWVTPLEVPVVRPWKPQPKPKPVVVKREIVKEVVQPTPVVVAKPKIYDPVFKTPVAKVALRHVDPAPEIARVLPDPKVSLGSSAIPKLRVPVQTGGFGDPNGVPDNGKRDRNPNIALQGSFDMPAGPGLGNGNGGKHGARGTVASAGFGNGVAVGSAGGPRGSVEQGGFGSELASAAPRVRQVAESNTKPVVILSVPRPVYTAEGRNNKIQGVVLLQVIFTATGQVKVERVVKGLGYGLDQAAEDAARQIRFNPATRGGEPVDFSAIARIVFELAY
ncbi:MAG: energy transducer TonB [Candidatus Acidiferrales bacterium]